MVITSLGRSSQVPGLLASVAWQRPVTSPSADTLTADQLKRVVLRSSLLPADPLPVASPPTPYDIVAKALKPADVAVLASLKDRGLLAVTDRQGTPLIESLRRIAVASLLTPDPEAEQALIARQQAAKKKLDDWTAQHPGTLTAAEQTEKKALQQALKLVTTAPFALTAEAYRAEVLGALLSHFQDPLTNTDQGNYGTCAPAIAQRHMITEDPADYARLVAELFIDGESTEGTKTYVLNRENLVRVGWDNPAVTSDARDWVDMAVQSTLIDGETPGTYDKITEDMARPAEVAKGVPQGRGLDSNGRLHLQANLLDGAFRFVDREAAAKAGSNQLGVDLLKSEMDAAETRYEAQAAQIAASGAHAIPEPVFVEIRFNWGSPTAPASHAIAAVGRTATHLIVSNPQGNLFEFYKRQKKYPVLADPDNGKAYVDMSSNTKLPAGMRVYEDGLTAFPWETVEKHLWGVFTRQE